MGFIKMLIAAMTAVALTFSFSASAKKSKADKAFKRALKQCKKDHAGDKEAIKACKRALKHKDAPAEEAPAEEPAEEAPTEEAAE